jgi:hypothetical protein
VGARLNGLEKREIFRACSFPVLVATWLEAALAAASLRAHEEMVNSFLLP